MRFDLIHSDKRGFIGALTEDLISIPELSIMKTKAGLMRGGCIHRVNSEHLCVIEGKILYFYSGRGNASYIGDSDVNGNWCVQLEAGEVITIKPNTPHYMLSITDSIIAEWGCTLEEKKEKYLPFREIVETHNALDKTQ